MLNLLMPTVFLFCHAINYKAHADLVVAFQGKRNLLARIAAVR